MLASSRRSRALPRPPQTAGSEPNPPRHRHRGASGYLPSNTLPGTPWRSSWAPTTSSRPGGHKGRSPDRASRAEHPNTTNVPIIRVRGSQAHGVDVDGARGRLVRIRLHSGRDRHPAGIQPLTSAPRGSTGVSHPHPRAGDQDGQALLLAHRAPYRIYPETNTRPTTGSSPSGWSRGCLAYWTTRLEPPRRAVFIQSFEQSNLRWLNRRTKVGGAAVDANDVNPERSLDYTAPSTGPTLDHLGRPRAAGPTFGFFATDEGLDEVAEYADGIGPWKPYINSTAAIDINANGNRRGRERRRRPTRPTASSSRPLIWWSGPRAGCSCTRKRSATSSAGWPTTTRATRSTSTCAS